MGGILILLLSIVGCISFITWYTTKSKHTEHNTSNDKKCYTIKAEQGTSCTIKDSAYIISKIGCFVAEGSKNGLNDIDIRVDLRYTQASSVYKAIGALESEDGIKVSEKPATNPSQIIFNIQWAKLPNMTT